MKKLIIFITFCFCSVFEVESAFGQEAGPSLKIADENTVSTQQISKKWGFIKSNLNPSVGFNAVLDYRINLFPINSVFNQKGFQTLVDGHNSQVGISLFLGRNLYVERSYFDNVVSIEENRADNYMIPASSSWKFGISPLAWGYDNDDFLFEIRPLLELSSIRTNLIIKEKLHNGSLTDYLTTLRDTHKELKLDGFADRLATGLTVNLGYRSFYLFSFSVKRALPNSFFDNQISFSVPDLPEVALTKYEFSIGAQFDIMSMFKEFSK